MHILGGETRRRHAATTVLRVPDDTNFHLVARSHALSCCWDRAREPRKPREFCFQPKPSFDRPHRPHEHGVALSVRKVLYGYGTHGVCILEPPQTSCRNFLRCQAAVALTTPPHAAQSRRARTARVRKNRVSRLRALSPVYLSCVPRHVAKWRKNGQNLKLRQKATLDFATFEPPLRFPRRYAPGAAPAARCNGF